MNIPNRLFITSTATLALAAGAAAQQNPIALEVIDHADHAFQQATAIHYFGSYSRSEHEPSADAPESFTVEGAVWLKRNPEDALLGWKLATSSSTAYGPEPPLIRATWNGETVGIVYPTRRSAITCDPTLQYLGLVTDFQRAWIMDPYMTVQEAGGASATPLRELVWEGSNTERLSDEEIQGTHCRVVRITAAPSDDPRRPSTSITTLWIADDGFLRRLHKDWIFGGTRFDEQWEYRGVIVGPDLADELFEPWIPEGFEHIHRTADGNQILVAGLGKTNEPPAAAAVDSTRNAPPAIGDVVPEIQFTMPDGTAVELSSMRGSAILLDFWGTWCGPCIMALPTIQKLHDDFADKGLTVLGVSANEPESANPQKFLQMRNVTYQTAVKGEIAARQMGVQGYPHVFLIDAEGVLRGAWIGYSEEESRKIRAAVQSLLVDRDADQ